MIQQWHLWVLIPQVGSDAAMASVESATSGVACIWHCNFDYPLTGIPF